MLVDPFEKKGLVDPFAKLSEPEDTPVTTGFAPIAAPVAEAAVQFGTGLIGQAVGGLAGLGTIAGNKLGLTDADPTEVINKTASALTYQPRTGAGKALSEAIAVPMEALEKGIQNVSDIAYDPTAKTRQEIAQTNPEAAEVLSQHAKTFPALGAGVNAGLNVAPIPFLAKGRRVNGELVPEKAIEAPEVDPILEPKAVGADVATITPESTFSQAMDAISAKAGDVGRELIDVTGGKAISYLDEVAKVSPTAKELRDMMEYTEFSDTPIGPTFHERLTRNTGEFVSRMDDALDPISRSFYSETLQKRLRPEVNESLVKAVRGIEDASGKVGSASKELRSLLDDMHKYANETGLEVGYVKNYFPRVYNKYLKTDKGRQQWGQVLRKHGIDVTDADDIARKIINEDGILIMEKEPKLRVPADELVGNVLGAKRVMAEGGARHQKNLETARKLARIPDKELAPFLENDVPGVLSKYISGVVRRAEYARTFGAGEGKLNDMVRDIIRESDQTGRPIRQGELQRIYNLVDTFQRRYGLIQSEFWRNANTMATTQQYMLTMTLSTLSSLSEPFLILARGRLDSTLKAVPAVLNHVIRQTVRGVYKKFPKAEATKAIENLGVGLDAALAERLTATAGGEVTKLGSMYFKLILLHQWTRFNRVAGYESGWRMVRDHLQDLPNKTGARKRQIERELTELGIDPKEGLDWVNRGADMKDPYFEKIKYAGLRFTDEVVMNPRSTNRPLWHSNPHVFLLSQLKGYATVFGNTTMKRWYHMIAKRGMYEGTRNSAKIAATGVLMIAVAMWANEFRERRKHGPEGNPKFKNEPPMETLYRAVDRAGFTGAFQIAGDMTKAHRWGKAGLVQGMGPFANYSNELIEAIGVYDETGDKRPLGRVVANSIPIANVSKAVRDDITDRIGGPKPDRGRASSRSSERKSR